MKNDRHKQEVIENIHIQENIVELKGMSYSLDEIAMTCEEIASYAHLLEAGDRVLINEWGIVISQMGETLELLKESLEDRNVIFETKLLEAAPSLTNVVPLFVARALNGD